MIARFFSWLARRLRLPVWLLRCIVWRGPGIARREMTAEERAREDWLNG